MTIATAQKMKAVMKILVVPGLNQALSPQVNQGENPAESQVESQAMSKSLNPTTANRMLPMSGIKTLVIQMKNLETAAVWDLPLAVVQTALKAPKVGVEVRAPLCF